MNDNILVDSNVLVYAYDRSEPQKQTQAVRVLDHWMAGYLGVLSTQVLAEFFMTVTKKIIAPLSIKQAYSSVVTY